ncbi:MAG TPA: enoyl-CoA hydratase/isomerase family protein [Solirubrobacteraceae bacterium]|jgi:enoyl-CoA hydratase/carnithine racemase
MPDFAALTLDLRAPIARLTLDRPERLNALSPELLAELIEASEAVALADAVKVVIVSGAGRAFCAGFDLNAAAGKPDRDRVDLGRRMADAVSGIRAITIASIHGHCVGGGLVLAAACDIRLATEDARFSIPEVDLGIPLAWGGIPRLVRELGPALTKELVLTCRPFTPAEAQAARFVNRVVPAEELEHETEALAKNLASKAPFLIRHTKQLVDALVEDAYSTGQSFRDADVTLAALADDESRAAMLRYLEARSRR